MTVEWQEIPLPRFDEPETAERETPAPDEGPTAVDWSTGEVLRVHPLAAQFPMLEPEPLADLAADIEANGLQVPAVLDSERQLIDGRNRLAACAVARVEPCYTTLEPGVDPVTYIIALNVQRRHLSKGQCAMAVALACSESEQTYRAAAASAGITLTRLAVARIVLAHAKDLVPLVMAGSMGLDAAYETARANKVQQEEQDAAKATAQEKLLRDVGRLRRGASDLAELVAEERISLPEAIAALDQREREEEVRRREEQERRERVTAQFAGATATLRAILHNPAHNMADDWEPSANHLARVAGLEGLWTRQGLTDIADRLGRLAADWRDAERKE